MKFIFVFVLFLAACASQEKKEIYDRTEDQEEYAEKEQENLKKSLSKSEVKALARAMDTRIKAVDQQIQVQKDLIKKWEAQKEQVASAEAMIENANLRIGFLEKERAVLVQEKAEMLKGME
jgi:hypothetical protein